MLRCDGRLTPSACLHIVKVFVGLQGPNAPVRDSGQRENRSCTAFADKDGGHGVKARLFESPLEVSMFLPSR